ncbi:hypothetical protein [Actinoplanes flavus]|uniref:Uncharacterized protein n=1 Tax=Actinoplanes flavus TaxID=2820290 RepID=A0ABS3UWF0_9ACTN|nr:hypothetical protein [Actinoplanes flavus]MBO3739072.1 hypothetical protein [Actinoplanes flavus]MBO3742924.1 hypothetical protein [Actinoplanes flavus]
MTNSIGSSVPSVATRAASLFGGARETLKAIAEAAVPSPDETPAADAVKKGRQGTVLDCYA